MSTWNTGKIDLGEFERGVVELGIVLGTHKAYIVLVGDDSSCAYRSEGYLERLI